MSSTAEVYHNEKNSIMYDLQDDEQVDLMKKRVLRNVDRMRVNVGKDCYELYI